MATWKDKFKTRLGELGRGLSEVDTRLQDTLDYHPTVRMMGIQHSRPEIQRYYDFMEAQRLAQQDAGFERERLDAAAKQAEFDQMMGQREQALAEGKFLHDVQNPTLSAEEVRKAQMMEIDPSGALWEKYLRSKAERQGGTNVNVDVDTGDDTYDEDKQQEELSKVLGRQKGEWVGELNTLYKNYEENYDDFSLMAEALYGIPGDSLARGIVAGASRIIASVGLDDETATRADVAKAMLSKTIKQKPAGSGVMTDADLRELKRLYPQIWNTDLANAVMVVMARKNMERAQAFAHFAEASLRDDPSLTQSEISKKFRDENPVLPLNDRGEPDYNIVMDEAQALTTRWEQNRNDAIGAEAAERARRDEIQREADIASAEPTASSAPGRNLAQQAAREEQAELEQLPSISTEEEFDEFVANAAIGTVVNINGKPRRYIGDGQFEDVLTVE